MPAPAWVGLFSGGKDSSWAVYQALEQGLPLRSLLTVHAPPASYMYHVPATQLCSLAAEAMALPLIEVQYAGPDPAIATDAAGQGDAELTAVEDALHSYDDACDGCLAGVTAGAIASQFQTDRIRTMCDRLEIDLFAPLWQEDPERLGRAMIDAGFDIRIIQVAAAGLDAGWLGRRLDHAALDELLVLAAEVGLHPLGEGGEYETLVVDAPHMARPIRITGEPQYAGGAGRFAISDARLAA
jgi:ABC transporter with metal-binding/Fe-S-binding domain ATP-binding protein